MTETRQDMAVVWREISYCTVLKLHCTVRPVAENFEMYYFDDVETIHFALRLSKLLFRKR